MTTLLALLGLGFLLGMRHATDPDHVIAVTTIVSRERNTRQAALIGLAWGAGHTFSILVVGSATVLLRVVFPPRVGLVMELTVGVMLVVLGLRNMGPLFGASVKPMAVGETVDGHVVSYHQHGDYIHAHNVGHQHAHPHDPDKTPLRRIDRWFSGWQLYQLLRPVLVGTVHGLAGSAALALLVLSTLDSVHWAVAYLLMFGLGTILGMTLITVALASAFSLGQTRFHRIGRHFGLATGFISIAFGLFIAYQIGFVHGLFTGQVTWTPQ